MCYLPNPIYIGCSAISGHWQGFWLIPVSGVYQTLHECTSLLFGNYSCYPIFVLPYLRWKPKEELSSQAAAIDVAVILTVRTGGKGATSCGSNSNSSPKREQEVGGGI